MGWEMRLNQWGNHRTGLKHHSREFEFYHLCVGGSLQILMEFALSINGLNLLGYFSEPW